MKDGKIDNNEAKKISKTLEDMEGSKTDYSKLVYRSGDNEHFDFTRFGLLSSFYLKFINANIGINVAKLNMKEFKNEIDRLKRKKAKKQSYKTNKKDVLENAKAWYNGLNIIVDAFDRDLFRSINHPFIDADYDSNNDQEPDLLAASGSNIYESYGLTDKELQVFKKLFGCKNPEELRQALIEATDEKYNDVLKELNIKLTVLRDQTKIKTGVSRTRLENLVNVVEDILDGVRWGNNIPDLESEKSAAQRRNESSSGQGLKILTPDQMLNRLPISLAQLNAGNNSEKFKNEIRQLL